LEFFFSFPNQIYLINYILEDQFLMNFSFSLDLFFSNKISMIQKYQDPLSMNFLLFFQTQTNFENLIKLINSDFFKDVKQLIFMLSNFVLGRE